MPAEGGIAKFVDGDGDLDYNGYPDTVPRRCGDLPCCVVFFLCLLGLGTTIGYTFKTGRLERFEGLSDYNGKFCGVSTSVVNKPYLYFCREGVAGSLSRKDRICVEDCDVAATGVKACPGGGNSQPYPAFAYAGLLCMPQERHMRQELDNFFLGDPDVGLFMIGVAFSRAWPAVFLSVIITIALSFLYVCVVSKCKRCLVLCLLCLIVVFGLILGIYLMSMSNSGGADGLSRTGDEYVSFAVGTLIIVVCFVTMLVAMLYALNTDISIVSIKAGAECIWDSPSIVFEPFVHLAFKLTIMIGLLVGLLRLLTWMQTDYKYYAEDVSIRVRMNYTWWQVCLISYYIFMCVWIMEVLQSLSAFTVAYASQLWYFAPFDKEVMSKEVNVCASCKAVAIAIRYHLGTLIYGSFCNAFFRFPRMLVGAIVYAQLQQERENQEGYSCTDNNNTGAMSKVCGCCISAYNGFLAYMTPWAFMDVSLNGSRFCKAGYFSVTAMGSPQVKYVTLHGSTWLVQFVGHVLISTIGGLHTYLACRTGYIMGEMGIHQAASTFYIPRPSVMGVLAFMICWGIAQPFLVLPGNISDNILFCYSVERKRWASAPVSTMETGWFMPCAGRQTTQQHVMGSARAQPPATAALLTEARQDSGREE